jgi:hypothetical protein
MSATMRDGDQLASERRQDDREDRTAAVPFVQKLALMNYGAGTEGRLVARRRPTADQALITDRPSTGSRARLLGLLASATSLAA